MNTKRFALIGGLALAGLLHLADDSLAANWKAISPREDRGRSCIRVGAQDFDYFLLDGEQPTVLRVRGPQRLKIITRYLFGETDSQGARYRINVRVDGREELRRNFNASDLPSAGLCRKDGQVAGLKRVYLNVPTGLHDIQILADAPGDGRIAARFFRESRGRETKMVNFSPERFDAVYKLQFDGGSQSIYYHFTENSPLRFSVIGPTTIEIDTRLDFDHTMSGSTSYQLEIVQNGEALPRFIYHTSKIGSASYIERRDILPGERKRSRLTVPRGRQEYEIHCSGPQNCGVAVRIRIPEADLQGK